MARALIIGCGCRGVALARDLIDAGHAVRGTTRDARRAGELHAAGIEPVVGDPDRISTLTPALEHVSVACILLGHAQGAPDALQALHGTRLEMLLLRMLDSTVRSIVYELPGDGGGAGVRAFCEDSRIPYALLDAPPEPFDAWLPAAREAVLGLLAA